jgi:hypothetical protein
MILTLGQIKPTVISQNGLIPSFKTKPVPLEASFDTVCFGASAKSKAAKKPPFEPTDLNFAKLLKYITDEVIAGRLTDERVNIDSPFDEQFGVHASRYTLKDGRVVTLGGDFVDRWGGEGHVIEIKEKGAKKAQRFNLTETMGELTFLAFEAYTTAYGMYSYGDKPDADDQETLKDYMDKMNEGIAKAEAKAQKPSPNQKLCKVKRVKK